MRISDWSSDVGSSDLASDDHLDLVASHRRFIEKCDGNEATVLRRDFRYRNVASFRLTILREQAWHFRVVANLLRRAFQPGFPNLLDPFTYIRDTRKFVRSSVLEPEAPTARAVDQLIAADVAAACLGSIRFYLKQLCILGIL